MLRGSFALQSDSEYMAGQLSAFGYDVVDEPEGADLWLINTYDSILCCTCWFFILARSICELY